MSEIVVAVEEKSVCLECEDGWMVKAGDRCFCSHCGESCPLKVN